jgi:hypothetical protein
MISDHARLRSLVLMFEELEAGERQETDAHLHTCADCRRLRERLLAAESTLRAVPGLSADEDSLASASPLERAQASASLASLLAGQRTRFRLRLRRIMPLAIAATIVFVAMLPTIGRRSPVRDLAVGSPLVIRGDEDSPAATEFGVSFRLTHAGYPVLIHVDGAGVARLIHPVPGEAPASVPADQLVLLPPPRSSAVWRADLAPGCETYLLAVATEAVPDAGTLAALPAELAGSSRDDAVRGAAKRLGKLVGAVVRLDGTGCE